jgi:hypothetical protein
MPRKRAPRAQKAARGGPVARRPACPPQWRRVREGVGPAVHGTRASGSPGTGRAPGAEPLRAAADAPGRAPWRRGGHRADGRRRLPAPAVPRPWAPGPLAVDRVGGPRTAERWATPAPRGDGRGREGGTSHRERVGKSARPVGGLAEGRQRHDGAAAPRRGGLSHPCSQWG